MNMIDFPDDLLHRAKIIAAKRRTTLRDLMISAVTLRRFFQFSHWESSIIAAARHLGCQTLYSEDLSHGRDQDGVRVVTPFL
jgi:predicted nucleic acid-binding protein